MCDNCKVLRIMSRKQLRRVKQVLNRGKEPRLRMQYGTWHKDLLIYTHVCKGDSQPGHTGGAGTQ